MENRFQRQTGAEKYTDYCRRQKIDILGCQISKEIEDFNSSGKLINFMCMRKYIFISFTII